MTDIPDVSVSPHDERPESRIYRAHASKRVVVSGRIDNIYREVASVRTTHGRIDNIYVRHGRWGGLVDHDAATALAEQLARATEFAEDPDARWGLYFRARTPDGTAVTVRMGCPVVRTPETQWGGIDYIRIGGGRWGGSIEHAEAVALHACLRAALAQEDGDPA